MKRFPVFVLLLSAVASAQPAAPHVVQFLFTSDAHYGISRSHFRGETDVDAYVVNESMIAKMNKISGTQLSADGGVRAGQPVGPIDFVVETGDIANREETAGGAGGQPIQPATTSWTQFLADYMAGLTLTDASGRRSALFVAPGNHDVTNAVGFYKTMRPTIDAAAMVGIYNLMMRPAQPKTASTYNYDTDRVRTSRDVGGVHLVFMNVWPDSRGREFMERDLSQVPLSTPVFIFTHDQPDAEAKHFINPNGAHDINPVDKFENLLSDRFADGPTIEDSSIVEQRALVSFLKAHINVRAYFHGNSNWTEFYDWGGPDGDISLPTFRVDSPIKGKFSATDETRLAFELGTVDMDALRMTVRECLWNAEPANPAAPVKWGASRTISLRPGIPASSTAEKR